MNFEKPCGEVWYRRVDDVLACQGTTQGWQGLVEETIRKWKEIFEYMISQGCLSLDFEEAMVVRKMTSMMMSRRPERLHR